MIQRFVEGGHFRENKHIRDDTITIYYTRSFLVQILNVAALVFFKKSVSLGPRIRPSKRDRIGNWFFEKPYIPCLIWKEISIVEIRKTQEDLVEWRNLQRNPRQTEWLFLDFQTKKDSQVMQIIAWSVLTACDTFHQERSICNFIYLSIDRISCVFRFRKISTMIDRFCIH